MNTGRKLAVRIRGFLFILFFILTVCMTLGVLSGASAPVYAQRAVKIAHATIGENGSMYGTKPGDQTGKEVCIANYKYKVTGWSGWTSVTRANDPELGKRIAAVAILAVRNDNIGYGKDKPQFYPAAKAVGFDVTAITEPVNCDCVAFAQTCAMAAGAYLGGGYRPYSSKYFTVIEDPAVCSNPDLLMPGDILETRNEKNHHVAVVCSVTGLADETAALATFSFAGPGSSSANTAAANTAAAVTVSGKKDRIERKPFLKKVKPARIKATVNWKPLFKKTPETSELWSRIKRIEIEYGTDPSFSEGTRRVYAGKKKTKTVLRNLQRQTVYYVHIRYTDNAGGYSDWTRVREFRTK